MSNMVNEVAGRQNSIRSVERPPQVCFALVGGLCVDPSWLMPGSVNSRTVLRISICRSGRRPSGVRGDEPVVKRGAGPARSVDQGGVW